MKKLNLVVGLSLLLLSGVLAAAACLTKDISMWPDVVMATCMGVLCVTTALEK